MCANNVLTFEEKIAAVDILVASVSGGSFVNQVASSMFLAANGYKPRLALGASGGALTLYIMEICKWDNSRVTELLSVINSRLFITKPVIPVLGLLPSIYRGHLYERPTSGHPFMRDLMEQAIPFDCEIWSGSQDTIHHKSQFACNFKRESSLLKVDDRDITHANMHPPVYLDREADTLAWHVTSSFAIPVLLPGVMLDGNLLTNPGMVYGSPVYGLRKALARVTSETGHKQAFHFTILTITDMDTDLSKSFHRGRPAIVTNLINQILASTHANMRKDRLSCMDVMYLRGMKECDSIDFKATPEAMKRLSAFKIKSPGTLTEVYPKLSSSVSLTDLTSEQLLEAVALSMEDLCIRLRWYVSSDGSNEDSIADVAVHKLSLLTSMDPDPDPDPDLAWLIHHAHK